MIRFIKKPITLADKDLEKVLTEIMAVLEKLTTNQSVNYILLEPLKKEPDKKYNGMIVYFDNVGGKTGFYGYENGNWIKL